jgi:hypothetical protein
MILEGVIALPKQSRYKERILDVRYAPKTLLSNPYFLHYGKS